MLGHKERGSVGLIGMASVLALSLAAFYVKNTSDQSSSAIKKARMDGLNGDAQNNNLSNLSLLRAMLNASAKGPPEHPYEPVLYASNYFDPRWTFAHNPTIDTKDMSLNGRTVKVQSFEAERSLVSAHEIFNANSGAQIKDMKNFKTLEILDQHPNKDHPYWIESIDVRAKNSVAAKGGLGTENATNKAVDSIGRIYLLPPEPGPITVEIKPTTGGTWSTDFGSMAKPLPPGDYQFRVTGNGVTYYALITRPDGADIQIGLKDGKIIHQANNIKAKNVVIGISEPVRLGKEVKDTKTVIKPEEVVNVTVPAAEGSPGSGPKISQAGCNFAADFSAVSSPSAPPATSTSSSSSTTSTSTSTQSSTVVASDMMTVRIAAYGVDERESPNSEAAFDKTLYVTKTTILETITSQTVTTNTSAGGSAGPAPGPGYDGNNCRSRCPTATPDALADPYVWTTMWRNASDMPADKRLTDFYEQSQSVNGLQNGLRVQGVVCSNFEMIAQALKSKLGLPNVADMKNRENDANGKWNIFAAEWQQGTATRNLERYFAYTAPSCTRQLVGDRISTCGCFEESTAIRMADGSERPAASIRQGDRLWNPKTASANTVKRVIAGPEKLPLYAVKVLGNTVRVTQGHPFLTPQGLKAAKDLQSGDFIVDNGAQKEVESVTIEERKIGVKDPEVWNFEMEGTHDDDHYVLANGVMTGDLYLQIKLQKNSQKLTTDTSGDHK